MSNFKRPNIEAMKRIRKYNDRQLNSLEVINLFLYIEYLEKKLDKLSTNLFLYIEYLEKKLDKLSTKPKDGQKK